MRPFASDITFAPDIFDQVLKCFDSNIEEVKSAAAFAAGETDSLAKNTITCRNICQLSLGNIAVGNVATFLPRIVQQVSGASSPATRLLYLHSLKEVIDS